MDGGGGARAERGKGDGIHSFTYRAPLCDLGFMLWMSEEIEIGVCVHVNKAWGEIEAFGLDASGRTTFNGTGLADSGNQAIRHQHVRNKRWC